MKTGIVLALLAVVILGAFLVAPDLTQRMSSVLLSYRNRSHTYVIGNLTVKGRLNRSEAELAGAFLTDAVRPEYLPKTLWFQLAPRPTDAEGPDAYIANWNKDGKPVSILFGKTQDGKNPAYLRIWTMPPGDTVTQEEADTLIDGLFSESYQSLVGETPCSATGETTECAALKTLDDGSMRGLTVRAPFLLEPPSDFPAGAIPPEEVIIVSSCLVPADGAPYYRAPSCL